MTCNRATIFQASTGVKESLCHVKLLRSLSCFFRELLRWFTGIKHQGLFLAYLSDTLSGIWMAEVQVPQTSYDSF